MRLGVPGRESSARSLQAQGGCDGQRRRDRQPTASISGFTLRTRGRSQETLGWGGSPGDGPRGGAPHAGGSLSCDCEQVREAGLGRGRRVFTQRTRRRVLLEAVGLGWPFSVFPNGAKAWTLYAGVGCCLPRAAMTSVRGGSLAGDA